MNYEQLKKGINLEKSIDETKDRLSRCQKALSSIENSTRVGSGGLYLNIAKVPRMRGDYPVDVSVEISDEQMIYSLILAEKKIQRELDQLTTEFENL